MKWYEKSRTKADPEFLYKIGEVCEKINQFSSLSYYKRSANLGNIKAQMKLAFLYEKFGFSKLAFEVSKKLAEQGISETQMKLASVCGQKDKTK